MPQALVFGGTGAIGSAVTDGLRAAGFVVASTGRQGGDGILAVDPMEDPASLAALDGVPALDAVVWAQGANVNDSAQDVQASTYGEIMAANVTYVVVTLGDLLRAERLAMPARMVVISSIWEQVARPGKFSYTVSKAALGGLVRAAAADLAPDGHLINAVGPGVTDTAMTRAMLSEAQVERMEGQTGFGRLTALGDVAAMVVHLCSEANSGVTGQSIAVDLGFASGRRL
jgi:NAD(P)-dependent dehydrogenase (short-subunit alcohol dehydrogenase family)